MSNTLYNRVNEIALQQANAGTPWRSFVGQHDQASKGERIYEKQLYKISESIVIDIGDFMDHDIHPLLEKYDITKVRRLSKDEIKTDINRGSGEAFEWYVSVEEANEIIIEVVSNLINGGERICTKKPFTPRYGQEDTINESLAHIKQSNTCTVHLYTGGGKSFLGIIIALHSLSGHNGAGILVSTPMASTVTSFTKAIDGDMRLGAPGQKYSYMTAKTYNEIEFNNRIESGEFVFLILTAQDYFYEKDTYNSVATTCAAWIMDERHFLYEGIKTSQKIAGINIPITINLTATPNNIIDKVSNVVSRGLCWAIKNREHTNVPVPHIACVNSFMSNSKVSGVQESDGFKPEKYFQRNDNEDRTFKYGSSIVKIANLMYTDDSGPDLNPLSIMDDVDMSEISKQVGMWVLPKGDSGEYIPQLTQYLNENVEGRLFLCAYDMGSDPNQVVQQKIAEGHKNITILTCDMFIIGTDIPIVGHIVLWRSMSSTSRFIQLIGRMQRVLSNKSHTKIYCMGSNMEIENTLFEIAKEEAESDGVGVEEYLKCLPLTQYDLSGSITKLTATDILKDVHNHHYVGVTIDLNEFQSSLGQIDLSTINFVPSKSQSDSTTITEDNNAKTRSPRPKNDRGEKSLTIQQLAKKIQSFTTELIWIAASLNETDVHILKNDERIVSMFSDSIGAIHTVLNEVDGLDKKISDFLYMKLVALRNCEFEEIHDVMFNNTPEKKSVSCVYTPIPMAENLIDSNIDECYNRGCRDFAIVNSLSGSMAYVLLEKYPDINLTCIEYFPYFINHLKSRGYNVVHIPDPSSTTIDMKFDVIIANFPFDDASSAAKNGKLWTKFTDLCIDNLLKSGGMMNIVSPTTILSKINYGKKKVRQFSTVQSLKAIDYSVGEVFFPTIGCPICKWTMVDRPYDGTTVVTDIKGEYEFDIRVGDGLPMRPERQVLQSILDKIQNSSHPRIPTQTGQQITSGEYVEDGKYEVYATGQKIKRTNTQPTTGTGLKFVIPFSASHKSRFITDGYIGMMNAWCPINSEEEGEHLMDIVDHPLIDLYITKQNRCINYESNKFTTTTGFTQVVRTNRLPYLESFDNLADQFNLTTEEVEYLKGVGIDV